MLFHLNVIVNRVKISSSKDSIQWYLDLIYGYFYSQYNCLNYSMYTKCFASINLASCNDYCKSNYYLPQQLFYAKHIRGCCL